MNRLTRDGTAEPISRDQILRRKRGQGNIHFPCSTDHEQDWESYPVDPHSCYMCDHTYMHSLRRPHAVTASFFVLLVFCFIGHVVFSEHFCTNQCRFPLPDGVFSTLCDHGLDFLHQLRAVLMGTKSCTKILNFSTMPSEIS